MKTIKTITLLLLAAIILFPLTASMQEEKKEERAKTLKYARGTREIDSRVIFSRESYVRGVQKVEISADMLGGFEPDYVEFYMDGTLIFLDSEPPFALDIDTGKITKKRNILVIGTKENLLAVRRDATGEAGGEGAITTTSDSFNIRIIEPLEGNYVVGRTAILVEPEFEDDAELVSVQLYVDGKLITTLTEAPWEYVHNFGRSFNGRRISVVAFDNFGRRAESATTTTPLENSTVFIETRVVTLDITATDDHGRFLGGLTADDFEIYDNNEMQEVRYFSTEERPIWVAILIDTSGSMQGGKIRRSVFAAQEFISQLKPADHAMVFSFGPEARLISEFSNDFPDLIDKIGMISAIRNAPTPLNQALYNAMSEFKDRVGRRAIIVISDGADTASVVTPDLVHEAAKKADVRIYPIAIQQIGIAGGGRFNDDPASYLMRGLADVTGGQSYFPISSSEFFKIFKTIAEELRSQYSVGYIAPKNDNNKWREIKVNIKKGGIARTKQGYYPDEY